MEECNVSGYVTSHHDDVTHVTAIADYKEREFLCISLILRCVTP